VVRIHRPGRNCCRRALNIISRTSLDDNVQLANRIGRPDLKVVKRRKAIHIVASLFSFSSSLIDRIKDHKQVKSVKRTERTRHSPVYTSCMAAATRHKK